MRHHQLTHALLSSLLVCVVCLATYAEEQDAALQRELQAMAGAWQVVYFETDGKILPADALKGLVMTRDPDGKFALRRGDQVVLAGMVKKTDTSKPPRMLDCEQTAGDQAGKLVEGIYEVVGDTLRICAVQPGQGERPTAFTARAGSHCTLAVYMRMPAK